MEDNSLYDTYGKDLYKLTDVGSSYIIDPERIASGSSVSSGSMSAGFLQSASYVEGISGWMINSDGNIEANDILLRGTSADAVIINYGSNILLKEGGSIKFTSVTAPTACTATLVATDIGNIDNGTHKYKVTYVNASGETELGAVSNTVTVDATHKQVNLSEIPISISNSVTQRKIYRTQAGATDYYLLTTINNNLETTYTDNTADAGLGTTIANDRTNSTAGKIMINGILCVSIGSEGGTTFLGRYAGYSNDTGFQNTFIGSYAGWQNTIGMANTFIGDASGRDCTTGYFNTYLGESAGHDTTTGSSNVCIGRRAGEKNTTGFNNTYIGYYAGNINTVGNLNTFVGFKAGYYETGSNKLFIDNAARADEADGRIKALIYGVFDATALSQQITFNVGTLNILDGGNIATGTGTGLKIGTATSQKLGFYNATPVDQPATVADATDAASVILRCNDIIDRLQELGLIQ